MLNFERLKKHILDNITEAQIKLGYEGRPMSLNYTCGSLAHLLGTEPTPDQLQQALADFRKYAFTHLGDLSFSPIKGGFCITVPTEGTKYVHEICSENSFISQLVDAVRDHRSLEEILAVFRSFSDHVSVTEVNSEEFQYLVYFEDRTPDEYVYCLTVDEEIDGSAHVTYHRFIREDYEDLGF